MHFNYPKVKNVLALVSCLVIASTIEATELTAIANQPLLFSLLELKQVPQSEVRIEKLSPDEIDFDATLKAESDQQFSTLLPDWYGGRRLTPPPGSHLCSSGIFTYIDADTYSSHFLESLRIDSEKRETKLKFRPEIKFYRLAQDGASIESFALQSEDLLISWKMFQRAYRSWGNFSSIDLFENPITDGPFTLILPWKEGISQREASNVLTNMATNLRLLRAAEVGEYVDLENSDFDRAPIHKIPPSCAGSYVIEDHASDGKSISYRRVEASWSERITGHRPSFQSIQLETISDRGARVQFFRAGLIDFILQPSDAQFPTTQSGASRPFEIDELRMGSQLAELVSLRFNLNSVKDEALRQAVALAAHNFEQFSTSFRVGQTTELAHSHFPHLGWQNPEDQFLTDSEIKEIEQRFGVQLRSSWIKNRVGDRKSNFHRQSLRKASDVLTEAGYRQNQFGEFLDPETNRPIELRAVVTAQSEGFFRLLSQSLRTIGLRLTLISTPDFAARTEILSEGNYELFIRTAMSAWNHLPYMLRAYFASNGNFMSNGGINDTTLDALINAMEATSDPAERLLLMKAIDHQVVSHFYVIPLLQRTSQFLLRDPRLQPRFVDTPALNRTGGPSTSIQTLWAKVKSPK